MELGQALFSNGEVYQTEMQQMVEDGLNILATLIALKRQDGSFLTGRTGGEDFENDAFIMRTYCWCDGDRPGHNNGCPPNFVHKETGFTCAWYKHVGRGNTQSAELGGMAWKAMLVDCLTSL